MNDKKQPSFFGTRSPRGKEAIALIREAQKRWEREWELQWRLHNCSPEEKCPNGKYFNTKTGQCE